MRCVYCNEDMSESGDRKGRFYCSNINHDIGEYAVIIYDDGLIYVYLEELLFMKANDYYKLNKEYLAKIAMLL